MLDFVDFLPEFANLLLDSLNLLPEFANLLLDFVDFLPEFANLLLDFLNLLSDFANLLFDFLNFLLNFLPEFANLAGQFLPGRGDLGAQLASVFSDSIACGQVFGRERLGGLFGLLLRDASGLEGAVYLGNHRGHELDPLTEPGNRH